MTRALKVDLLKFIFILFYFSFILTAINAWADDTKKKECGEPPFQTKILKVEKIESCYDLYLEVSFGQDVRYELSHVNFDPGDGKISNEWNSPGWKMESNSTDPTTGLGGLKVDDISNFGKDVQFKSFQVIFTYCPSEDGGDDKKSINVAYKAGQCIYYEKISFFDENDGTTDDGGDDDCDDNGGDDNKCGCDNSNDPDNGSSGDKDQPLTVGVNQIDPTCADPSGGVITLDIKGGVTPYEIVWDHGAASPILSSLTAGTYIYSVSDANGSVIGGEVILASSSEINVESNFTKPSCQGSNNGSIDLMVSGGTEPYSYIWGNGATSQSLTDLYAGTYKVTVTDANGCSKDHFIPLYNEINILLNADIIQPSCQDSTAGGISVIPSGGSEPYSFSWSNGETSNSIEGLADDYYEVTVTDNNGCSITKTYGIATDMGIDVSSEVLNTNCFDDPIGAIDLMISGGTGPFKTEWSNDENTEDIDGLTAGNYTVAITDALGCQVEYKTSVKKNDIIIGYEGITIPSCQGDGDGAISINLSNGTAPYDITWSNGSKDEDIKDLSAGSYAVTVTDAEGCVSDKSFTLPEPEPVKIDYIVNSNECSGSQDVIVTPSGGSLEYTYLWSGGSTSNELKNAEAGFHNVTVTDTRGCTASQEITVEASQNQPLNCLIDDQGMEVMCGSSGNQLSSNLNGAVSYSWTVLSTDGSWSINSASDQSQIEYTAGSKGSMAIFTLKVNYESGCEISCEKTIEACTSTNDQNPDDDNTGGTPCDDKPDGSSGGDNTPDDNAPDNNTPDDNTPDDNTPDDNAPDNNTPDENSGSTGDPGNDAGNCDDGDCGKDQDDENDANKDKSCTECFNASKVQIVKEADGYHYTLEISYEDCRYDLSHMTIEIPDCFDIINYSNSMNWKMEEVFHDPTTGLSGIKVDDIPAFGKDPHLTSFTVEFMLNTDDNECAEYLNCFAPVVAYKSSTCVYEETLESECYIDDDDDEELVVTAYPNPTTDFISIDLKNTDESASYVADIYDFNGEKTCSFKFENVNKEQILVDLRAKKQGFYLLKLTSSRGDCTTHRIVKY